MRRFIFFALIGAALVMISLPIRADDSVVLADSIQPVADSVRREALTPEERKASLSLEVTLTMRNFSEFQARVGQGERISQEDRVEKYEPSAADYQTVLDWLLGHGLIITRRDSHHLSIFVRGEIADMARAFDVRFARVEINGQMYVGALTAPRVPGKLAPLLRGINGLQPWHARH